MSAELKVGSVCAKDRKKLKTSNSSKFSFCAFPGQQTAIQIVEIHLRQAGG